jgi:hypothetical protein
MERVQHMQLFQVLTTALAYFTENHDLHTFGISIHQQRNIQ